MYVPSRWQIPDGYSAAITRAWQEKRLTPAEATAMHKRMYPWCKHGTPCDILVHGVPMCEECVKEAYPGIYERTV